MAELEEARRLLREADVKLQDLPERYQIFGYASNLLSRTATFLAREG